MLHETKLEMDDSWKTGSKCIESASYCCFLHPIIEEFVQQGNIFPQCNHKRIPHKTVWNKIIK